MLVALEARKFALFDDLQLEFGPGLNVITGETGAGKSMLIDAVELVAGGRASVEQVRTGEDKAAVDALFDAANVPEIISLASEAGFDLHGGQLVISREITTAGRNLCRVNGRVTTAAVVRALTGPLVEIHGQHEHQALLHAFRHRDVLDNYGGADLLALISEMASGYAALRGLQRELAAIAGDARDRVQREDLIRFQLAEIEAASLKPGEEEQLRQERQVMVNAERLAAAADEAYLLLYGASSPEGRTSGAPSGSRRQTGTPGIPARDALSQALGQVEAAAGLDERLKPVAESLSPLVYATEDAAMELRRYRERIEFDPARLDQVQSRLGLIALLKRKYADTVDGILAYARALREELEKLENSEASAGRLRKQISGVRAALACTTEAISAARQQAAGRLAPDVTRELRSLGMPSAQFVVRVETRPDPDGLEVSGRTVAFDATGADDVEFLLSPNPGEPARRLARAASGGELSRAMLAIKTVLARADRIPSLIFDEIDSGIGGTTAAAVGLRLARLGLTHQVFCVTHLPQIAAYADHHFVVRKESAAGRTTTTASKVSGDERLGEMARMLGSASGSAAALEHARELLGASRNQLDVAKST